MSPNKQPVLRIALRQVLLGCWVLLLALSIFGWGLHSKVSLYDLNVAGQVSTPIAKLLSEQERPTSLKAQQGLKPTLADCCVLAVAVAAVAFASPVELRRPASQDPPVKPIAFLFDGPSLLRPPPFPIA